MASDVEYLFKYLFNAYIYSSVYMSLHVFWLFSNWILFTVEFWESFARYIVCKYLLPVCNLSFDTLNSVFAEQ